MIIGDLDLGGSHPFPAPQSAQVAGSAVVEGGEELVYPRGGKALSESVTFYVRDWQGRGGQVANSPQALRYLLAQVSELVRNPRLNPTFIQWAATADGTAYSGVDENDGWYLIESFEPVMKTIVAGVVQVKMKATLVAPKTAPLGIWYGGGALPSNYSGGAVTLIGFPVNAANLPSVSSSRIGGDGTIPISISPVPNPLWFAPSATLSDWFKGGCRVYDTITAGGNAVPTNAFVHATWLEVKGKFHDFLGDMIVTNGLVLLRFQTGASNLCTAYLWNTALSPGQWQLFGTAVFNDNSGNIGLLRSFNVQRVGLEDVKVTGRVTTSAGLLGELTVRLQRGHYEGRIDLKPLSQANTSNVSLQLVAPANLKITYNSGAITDNQVGAGNLAAQADYPYAGSFINSATYPFISGLCWVNQPGLQPAVAAGNIAVGDSTGPALNAIRSYAIWAVPFGVSGSYSTANLQGEGEGGTLGTGWSSVADGAASGGNTAKCASGTAANNTDVFGTSLVLPPGTYDLWMRVRVTSTAGTGNMIFGVQENGAGGIIFQGGALAPSSFTTGYVWYRVYTGYVADGVKSQRFMCSVNVVLGTDYFVDEAAWTPKLISNVGTGAQDIAQQFLHDREARLVRAA